MLILKRPKQYIYTHTLKNTSSDTKTITNEFGQVRNLFIILSTTSMYNPTILVVILTEIWRCLMAQKSLGRVFAHEEPQLYQPNYVHR